jgi:hypothetical protein
MPQGRVRSEGNYIGLVSAHLDQRYPASRKGREGGKEGGWYSFTMFCVN